MWGNILTEVSFQPNFNIGFSNTRTDILIHLTQWQYWWWFWFTFIWVLYYFIILKVFKTKTFKFRPRIVTSLRPRGKWGDLLICFIPISWCINILINSNFLLKLIEWQNESTLFTIRIRGRQWYWVYKFDLKNITDILSSPKNFGHNKWFFSFGGDLQISDDYLHLIQLRSQNKWIKKYWIDLFSKNKTKNFNLVSNFELLNSNFFFEKNLNLNLKNDNKLLVFNTTLHNYNNYKSNFLLNYFLLKLKNRQININYFFNFCGNTNINTNQLFNFYFFDKSSFFLSNKKIIKLVINDFFFKKYVYLNKVNFSNFNEITRFFKKNQGTNLPIQLIKYPINKINFLNIDILKLKFNTEKNLISQKIVPYNIFLTIKQKKYKRRKKLNDFVIFYKDEIGKKTKNIKYSGKLFLKNNEIFFDTIIEPSQYYNLLKKNKKRGENIPIVYSKRLLRTQRTLVLPAHVNITAITNSYDVIHSWFIPGLGIKLDCIPGRATHHTFFVDNVGFYYGQCAEICGRYHHHMPIRVCALPFDHFLIWWHSFGLTKLLFTNSQKKYELHYSLRKYIW